MCSYASRAGSNNNIYNGSASNAFGQIYQFRFLLKRWLTHLRMLRSLLKRNSVHQTLAACTQTWSQILVTVVLLLLLVLLKVGMIKKHVIGADWESSSAVDAEIQ